MGPQSRGHERVTGPASLSLTSGSLLRQKIPVSKSLLCQELGSPAGRNKHLVFSQQEIQILIKMDSVLCALLPVTSHVVSAVMESGGFVLLDPSEMLVVAGEGRSGEGGCLRSTAAPSRPRERPWERTFHLSRSQGSGQEDGGA